MNYCGNCVYFELDEGDEDGYCWCKKLSMPCKAGAKGCMYFKNKE